MMINNTTKVIMGQFPVQVRGLEELNVHKYEEYSNQDTKTPIYENYYKPE